MNMTDTKELTAATEALSQARQAIDQAAAALGVELVDPEPPASMNDALRARAGRAPAPVDKAA